MAEIIPFRGVMYNPQKVDATSVMAPPYDIVTPELRETLYNRSPYNIIRIDFGKDSPGDDDNENRYVRAARWLNEWLQKEILIRDTSPAFYCYEADGSVRRLRGLLGAVRLEEMGTGRIHPHEATYSKPKADRLNIIRHCLANISPIFALYSSPERLSSAIIEDVVRGRPFIEAKNGDGFIHRLWPIHDENAIETIKKEISDKNVFIADGHHRYETALEFKNEMARKGMLKTGREPFNYVLMFLANMEDEGLMLLPTHRVVKTDEKIEIEEVVSQYFDITSFDFNNASGEEAARQAMFTAMQDREHSIGVFVKGEKRYCVLGFRGACSEIDSHESLRSLDVTILHRLVLEKLLKGVSGLEYEMNPLVAVEKVKNGSFQAVFFLNPTRLEDVRKVALAGQRMPPKSTYFYPKLLTGMVIYKF